MHLTKIFLLFCAILVIAHAKEKKEDVKKEEKKEDVKKEEKKEWSYKDTAKVYSPLTYAEEKVLGPKDWGDDFKKCSGKAQSPINIVSKKAKKTKFGPLKIKFDSKNNDFFSGKFVNTGKAPQLTLDKKKGNEITIKFDKKDYILEKLLFHFGCNDKKGSEHTLDGKAFALELQLMFFNKKFKNLEKAEKEKDGVLALSVFVKKSKNYFYYYRKTDGLDGLLTTLMTAISSGYVRIGVPVVATELPLKKLVSALAYKDKKDAPAYFTYKGSLTTPGCYENVRWVIIKKPVKISQYLLNIYRLLKTKLGYYIVDLCDNFRPIQKLEGRKVEIFEPEKKIEDEESDESGNAGSGNPISESGEEDL